MKDNYKYYVYKEDEDENYKKWWTTDETIIRGIKKSRTIEFFAQMCASLFLLSFIATCIFAGCEILIGLIISGICATIFFILTFILLMISSNIFGEYINMYYKSKEFKKLADGYKKEKELQEEKELKSKAKRLVEVYDILDSKELSKDQKIKQLKKYLNQNFL